VSLLPHPALHVRVAVMRAVIRRAGPDKALLRAARLRPCVPPGIASRLDLPYDRGDGDPMLDVFRPRDTGTDTGTPRPVIVWCTAAAGSAEAATRCANTSRSSTHMNTTSTCTPTPPGRH
jgi:hypothetical protein